MCALLETLESRRLLSTAGSVTLNGGLLHITGTSAEDIIKVASASGVTTVTVNGHPTEYLDNLYSSLLIDGDAGNDQIVLDLQYSTPAVLNGEVGNDTLIGGAGSDTLNGGDGNDTVSYASRNSRITTGGEQYNISGHIYGDSGEIDTLRDFESFIASNGDDELNFGQTDQIRSIDGGTGDDNIRVEFHRMIDPVIHGGPGNDTLRAYTPLSSAGTIYNKYINPNLQFDRAYVYGDDGNDTLVGDRGGTEYFGGAGSDQITYGVKIPTAFWNGSRWLLYGPDVAVEVSLDNRANDGRFGGDNIHSDIEEVVGTALADRLIGSTNSETLRGGNGLDTIYGNGGQDVIVDDEYVTTKIAPRSSSFIPSHVAALASGVTATFFNGQLVIDGTSGDDEILLRRKPTSAKVIELLIAGKVADTFTYSKMHSVVARGAGGNDSIKLELIGIGSNLSGGSGDDTLFGGSGHDRISGGDGNDWINGGAGNDTVYGDAGNDRIIGDTGRDYLNGGSGIDVLRGGDGLDRIIAKAGIDDYKANIKDTLSLLHL